MFFAWFRTPTVTRPPQVRARQRPALRSFRPQLEVLEGRDVPSTLTVTANLDSGRGSLRADIAAAKSGDTIVFSPTLNGQTINLTSGQLLINKSLTIQGPGAGELTISADNHSRVLDVNASQPVVVSGLTMANGAGVSGAPVSELSFGGAILDYSTLTISGCTISRNSAGGSGGGVFNYGTLTISSCTMAGNAALTGGAIYNAGTLTVTGSSINANTGRGNGGGVYNNGTLTMSQCTLSQNSTSGNGGGIYGFGTHSVTLTSCTLSNNTAFGSSDPWGGVVYGGGGLYLAGSTVTITNCTISNNRVSFGHGGGILIASGAKVYLDAFTLANTQSNYANGQLNEIFGSYLLLP